MRVFCEDEKGILIRRFINGDLLKKDSIEKIYLRRFN